MENINMPASLPTPPAPWPWRWWLIILVISLGLATFTTFFKPLRPSSPSQKLPEPEIFVATPAVALSFNPDPAGIPPNGTAAVQLKLASGTQKIAFFHVELTFDKSKILLAQDYPNPANFTYQVVKTTAAQANTSGRIIFAMGINNVSNAPAGNLTLTTFTFKPAAANPAANQSSSLVFDTTKIEIDNITPQKLTPSLNNGLVKLQICAPPGGKICTSATAFKTCAADGGSWSAPAACAAGQFCEVNKCCEIGNTDCQNNNLVNLQDYNVWRQHYGQTNQSGGFSVADFNHDQKVDGLDFILWNQHYVP